MVVKRFHTFDESEMDNYAANSKAKNTVTKKAKKHVVKSNNN